MDSRVLSLCICLLCTVTVAYAIEVSDSLLSNDIGVDSLQITTLSNTQNVYTDLIENIYRTPEAEAFMKYGDYSPSGFTGHVDISLPIYEISSRDIRIPIALHYSGSGIRVSEESSWVGLGWDLSVGGCINYIPAGGLDYILPTAQWSDYQTLFGLSTQDTFSYGVDNNGNPAVADIVNGLGECDFYSANFLGKSLMFFKNPDNGNYEIIGEDNARYQISKPYPNTWHIKDCLGTLYVFGALERSLSGINAQYDSAWYLSDIQTATGSWASFQYEFSTVWTLPSTSQKIDLQREVISEYLYGGQSPRPTSDHYMSVLRYTNTQIDKPWLVGITTENQRVAFNLSDRIDYYGAKKLDGIQVYDIQNNLVSSHILSYDYFSNSTVGGTCLQSGDIRIDAPVNTKRLKLLSLSRLSLDDQDPIKHEFEYYEDYQLPRKTSYAIDLWGYYNGEENLTDNSKNPRCPNIVDTHTLIPTFRYVTNGHNLNSSVSQSTKNFIGANRCSRRTHIKTYSLKKIKYPTGGYSIYEYEPHEFNSHISYPRWEDVSVKTTAYVMDVNYSSLQYPNGGPITHKQITLDEASYGELNLTFIANNSYTLRDLKNAGAKISIIPTHPPFSNRIELPLDSFPAVNLDGRSFSEVRYINLIPNTYMVVATLPDALGAFAGTVQAELKLTSANFPESSGGAGLRIAAIENRDKDGALLGRTEYDYTLENGKTSGRQLCGSRVFDERVMYNEKMVSNDVDGSPVFLRGSYYVVQLNSDFIGAPTITSSLCKGNVGYSRLVTRTYNGDGNLMRSIVQRFNTITTSEPVHGLHVFDTFGNGELLEQTVLDEHGDTINVDRFTYSEFERANIKCNAFVNDNYLNYVDYGYYAHQASRYTLFVYPYPRYWRALSSRQSTVYANNGRLTQTTSNIYNSTLHMLQSETSSVGQNSVTTQYNYASDISEFPYTSMSNSTNYMGGVLAETISRENGVEVKRAKSIYTVNHTARILYQNTSTKTSVGGTSLLETGSYKYDKTSGNLVEFVENTTDKHVLLWSYDNTCPVVRVDGATYNQVLSWLGLSMVSDLANATANIESLLEQVRNTLSAKNVLVTTYTFKPLVGISSETMPNGERREYVYDGFNRLIEVKDCNGNLVKSYDYHHTCQE